MKKPGLRASVLAVAVGVVASFALWTVFSFWGRTSTDAYGVYMDHRERMLRSRHDASPLSRQEAEQRSALLSEILRDAEALLLDLDGRIAAAVPGDYTITFVRPNWGAERSMVLPSFRDRDSAEIEAEAAGNQEILRIARSRSVLGRLRDHASYEGAISALEHSAVRGWRAGERLLFLEFIDALDAGDQSRAADAFVAARRLGIAVRDNSDRLGIVSSYYVFHFGPQFVLDSIELGLMTPEVARNILASSPEIDWADWRQRSAFEAVIDQIEQFYTPPHAADSSDSMYDRRGLLSSDIARRSLRGRVRVNMGGPGIYSDSYSRRTVSVPHSYPWSRHASLAQVAEVMHAFATEAGAVLALPRYRRDIDVLASIVPATEPGFVYPAPIDAMFSRYGGMSPDLLDSAEFFDNAIRVVLAIEVYRGEHGGVPGSLDDLVPGVLAEIPLNPFAPDGRFLYRADPESPYGYVLYSPGLDGVDHGGVRAPDQWHHPTKIHFMADYVIVPRELW